MLEVKLRYRAARYVRGCPSDVQDAFNRQRRKFQADPIALIKESDWLSDPAIRPYVLRSFEFAGHTAVCAVDYARKYIEIIECHPPRPEKSPRRGAKDGGKNP